MVDTLALGASAFGRAGSSPVPGTIKEKRTNVRFSFIAFVVTDKFTDVNFPRPRLAVLAFRPPVGGLKLEHRSASVKNVKMPSSWHFYILSAH